MLQRQSRVAVVDGTGVRKASVIKSLRGRGPRVSAGVGDLIRASVRNVQGTSPWRKGDLIRALVIRTRAPLRTAQGWTLRFGDNACVLVGDKKEFLGSHVVGPVPRQRRFLGYGKVLARAHAVV